MRQKQKSINQPNETNSRLFSSYFNNQSHFYNNKYINNNNSNNNIINTNINNNNINNNNNSYSNPKVIVNSLLSNFSSKTICNMNRTDPRGQDDTCTKRVQKNMLRKNQPLRKV